MSRLAIMQPYLFPYIGYFQLLNAVDQFIFYDDVNFIKQGWINRNKILLNGNEFIFTVPLKNASSFRLIKDIEVSERNFNNWKKSFFKTLQTAYKKAPYFEAIFPILIEVFNSSNYISTLAINSIISCASYIGIGKPNFISSDLCIDSNFSGKERVINICLQTKSSAYINAEGGVDLYNKSDFKNAGIELNFLKSNPIVYNQNQDKFISHLSIIDVLMYVKKSDISDLINAYKLF